MNPSRSNYTGLTTIKMLNWQRWFIFILITILSITGIWWWWDQHYLMNDPAHRAVLLIKIHGISAGLFTLLFGAIIATHVRIALVGQRNRINGVLLLAIFLILLITGLGLYYASELQRSIHQALHWWIGLSITLLFPLHLILGYRSRHHRKRT